MFSSLRDILVAWFVGPGDERLVARWCERYTEIIMSDERDDRKRAQLAVFWKELEYYPDMHRRVRRVLFQGGE